MANRLHLTIGEVLSLLREEFPDVSISKIRFLESQGLVEPERTPSGYRKFYDHDVERLRWILRQQREHFLPLKVIRGRLTGQEGDDPTGPSRLVTVESVVVVEEITLVGATAAEDVAGPEDSGSQEDSGPQSGAVAAGPVVGEAPTMNGADTFGDAVAPEDPENVDRPDRADRLFGPDDPPAAETRAPAPVPTEAAAMVPGDTVPAAEVGAGALADDTGAGDTVLEGTVLDHATTEETVAGDMAAEDVGPEATGSEPSGPGPESDAAVSDAAESDTGAADGVEPDGVEPDGVGSDGVGSDGVGSDGVGSDGVGSDGVGSDGVGSDTPSKADAGTPDIYSVAEIAEAVGCTPQLIRELQQFGILVAASDVGGKMYFEPDAVGLARVGARFAELGVEPRHLRTWRNAADREASLFEQLVMPLLRQRNPQSRRQAAERLDELSTLGSQLRAGLLAEAVRGIK